VWRLRPPSRRLPYRILRVIVPAVTPHEVGMCKTMNTVNAKYLPQYNRALSSIRNRIMVTAADLGRSIKVRIIGNGTTLTRSNGLVVKLYNTNVMLGSALPAAVAGLHPDTFNAVADAPDATEQSVIDYLRSVQNAGNLPFSVPVTNANTSLIGQGAIADCTVVEIKLQDGSMGLGLNFNRVIPAENGTSVASAFDQLMSGSGITTSTEASIDPFASTTVAADGEVGPPNRQPAASGRRAATA
jgi:hypothetical protein